jgi:hypothetical protein
MPSSRLKQSRGEPVGLRAAALLAPSRRPKKNQRSTTPFAQMKQISNEFIIRALQCDGGYEHAGFISSAASALLGHLTIPSCRLSPAARPRSASADPEKIESPARHKKILTKRVPVIYLPGPITFPRISVSD